VLKPSTRRIQFHVQKLILVLSYSFLRVFNGNKATTISWVVGPYETAGIVNNIAQVTRNSFSVVLNSHKFYDYVYNYIGKKNYLINILISPFILAKLTIKSSGFIYVGSEGFLFSGIDYREFEFRFLKKANKSIVCFFVGDDIRSPAKMHQNYLLSGEENFGTYLPWVNNVFESKEYEISKFNIARVSSTYSAAIFSSHYDQASYLSTNFYPVRHFYDFSNKSFDAEKFVDLEHKTVNILHAPSSPIVKGTQVVRTVIKMLEHDGFTLNYVEMIGVTNKEILQQLGKSHIVIDQLYAFMPGAFCVEAMANSCALLTRADSYFEKSLPLDSEKAWVITPSYLLYQNLRSLLENPKSIEIQALNGFNWAAKNCSSQIEGIKFQQILDEIQV